MKKYYIVGGQYALRCYGACDTILGAKRIASKNVEYWDNWQGWHTPAIFRGADMEFYGSQYLPKPLAEPIAYKMLNGKWHDNF